MSLEGLGETEGIEAHLYDDPSVDNLDLAELALYLKAKTPIQEIDTREPPVKNFGGPPEDLAEEFARTRVRNPETPKTDFEPLQGEIRFEEELVQDPASEVTGVLYDGFHLDKLFRLLLPEEEMDISHIHLIFINRLLGTWGEDDRRYHARVAVYGFPSLISTTGIVEAPAKPKEFYRMKRRHAMFGRTAGILEDLKEEFEGRFIDYDDERLTEVMKGYVMQAVFYHLTSEPFCEKEHCRLYNAHWQEEVLRAQLEPPEFCEDHEMVIKKWKVR